MKDFKLKQPTSRIWFQHS